MEQSQWDGVPPVPISPSSGVPLGSVEARKPDTAFPKLTLSRDLDVTRVRLIRWPHGRQAQPK